MQIRTIFALTLIGALCAATVVMSIAFAFLAGTLFVPVEVFIGFMTHAILEEGITASETMSQTQTLVQPASTVLVAQ